MDSIRDALGKYAINWNPLYMWGVIGLVAIVLIWYIFLRKRAKPAIEVLKMCGIIGRAGNRLLVDPIGRPPQAAIVAKINERLDRRSQRGNGMLCGSNLCRRRTSIHRVGRVSQHTSTRKRAPIQVKRPRIQQGVLRRAVLHRGQRKIVVGLRNHRTATAGLERCRWQLLAECNGRVGTIRS